MVDMAVLGISLQEDGSVPVLLLHPLGTGQILSLRIGPLEAFAISLALRGSGKKGGQREAPDPADIFPRPQTHDLLLNVLRAMGGTLASVDILHMVEGAFIAEAVVDHPGGRSRIDCRPSDGIALALRCGAPVRATSAVVANAEDIALVMAALPDYVRAMAAAKLTTLPDASDGSLPRLPRAIEAALASEKNPLRSGGPEADGAWNNQPEAEGPARRSSVVLIPAARKDGPPPEEGEKPKSRPGMPQIRVSLVRHKGPDQREIVEEFRVPSAGLPKGVIASLGLSRSEAEAVGAASDEERWAMLLRMLSPETKVPM